MSYLIRYRNFHFRFVVKFRFSFEVSTRRWLSRNRRYTFRNTISCFRRSHLPLNWPLPTFDEVQMLALSCRAASAVGASSISVIGIQNWRRSFVLWCLLRNQRWCSCSNHFYRRICTFHIVIVISAISSNCFVWRIRKSDPRPLNGDGIARQPIDVLVCSAGMIPLKSIGFGCNQLVL